jgi:hypothetical protein
MGPREPLLFVTLAVRDPARSRAFYTALGWGVDERFSDESSVCIAVSPHIHIMLLTEALFRSAAGRDAADTSVASEVLTSLALDSRFHVDQVVDRAVVAGAVETREPEDHGSQYSRSFTDPDGHVWEVMWMDDDAA